MRNKYRVIVLNPDYTLAYVSNAEYAENAKSIAYNWYNKTDSIGIRKYIVYISEKYKPAG